MKEGVQRDTLRGYPLDTVHWTVSSANQFETNGDQ